MTLPSSSGSLPFQNETGNCAMCGSASRVGRGLCLKCLLSSGIDTNGEHSLDEPTLDDLLGQIQVTTRIGCWAIIKSWKKLDAAGWASFIGRDNGIRAG